MYELNFKYELHGFSKETEEKLEKAISLFKYIYLQKQHEISQFILLHQKENGTLGFEQTEDNNLEILNKFFSPQAVWIKLVADYKRFGTARAYTYPNVDAIYFRVNKINFNSFADVVNTLAHEFSHKKGLTHSYKRSSSWPLTGPYGIGNFFEQLALKELSNTPIQIAKTPKETSVEMPPKRSLIKRIFGRLF